jgi:hypothetical protein
MTCLNEKNGFNKKKKIINMCILKTRSHENLCKRKKREKEHIQVLNE